SKECWRARCLDADLAVLRHETVSGLMSHAATGLAHQFDLGRATLYPSHLVPRVPFPRALSTAKSVFAFSCKLCRMSALSLPGTGHVTSSGRPMPSSATTIRYWSFCSCRQRTVIVPLSLPLKAYLKAFVRSLLTSSPTGVATLNEAGACSTLRSSRIP